MNFKNLIKISKDLIRYKFSKLNKNLIVFTSFNGHYSDSPKAIYEEFKKRDTGYRLVWLLNEKYIADIPDDLDWVEINSEAGKKALNSATCVIDNVYGPYAYNISNSFVSKLKGLIFKFCRQSKKKIFTTWHGTPLKRMARDQIGNDYRSFCCGNVTMFHGNAYTQRIMDHITFNKVKTKLLGTPRNDSLFLCQNKSIKERLELPIDKNVILFAPTFRNDGKDVEGKNVGRSGLDQLNEIDFETLFDSLHQKFGGDWVLVCRFHYHVEALVDWDNLNDKYQGRIINGNKYQDMADYLACTDILLTDASSCMFDFALTQKPCFLYFPDIDNYINKERGLYKNIEDLPYSCASNFMELIKNISTFDENTFSKKVEKMKEEFGFIDDGHASKRVVDYILKDLSK